MAPSYDKLGAMKNTAMILLAVVVESTALYLIVDNFFNYRFPLEFQIHYLQCLGIALMRWFYTIFLNAKEQREHYKVFLMERIALSLPQPQSTLKKKANPQVKVLDDDGK